MNEVTFKIARKGEGKTKWLINIANMYDNERQVYLYTSDDNSYRKFCEKYFSTYNRVCPVERLNTFKLTENDVVLVDDLFTHSLDISEIRFIQRNCYKLFITLEGEQADA